MAQHASKIFMVRPVMFGFNEQTAESNSFQQTGETDQLQIQKAAQHEFDEFSNLLKFCNINVEIFEGTKEPHTPDSIFPNNWISFHENAIVLYPMLAENRRKERRPDIINHFKDSSSYMIDLTSKEQENRFLEGTGSIVFDYEYKIAYANISPRTDLKLLNELCSMLDYRVISFKAVDSGNSDIYHTNVLMCIGKGFAVLCKECIHNSEELNRIVTVLEKTKHEIIEITSEQMNSFAGNMYQLYNKEGRSFIVMSEQAFQSLRDDQKETLEKYGTLIFSPLYTIEKYGGGSARCMIADVRWGYSETKEDITYNLTDFLGDLLDGLGDVNLH